MLAILRDIIGQIYLTMLDNWTFLLGNIGPSLEHDNIEPFDLTIIEHHP